MFHWKSWHLRDVILMALIAVFCGVISWGAGFLYTGLVAILTPFGLKPFANDALLGLWIISGPLAACVVRLPGAALLSEIVMAGVETVLGDQWGVVNLIEGVVQGCGSEIGFALTGYRHYNGLNLFLAAFSGTLVTFGFDWFSLGYSQYPHILLWALLLTRLGSLLIFSGGFPWIIIRLLKKSRALK